MISQDQTVSRVIGYIDGYNLYHGLMSVKWRQFLWICPQRLVQAVLPTGHTLVGVKYFTARVKGSDQEKKDRQSAFLGALRAVSKCDIIEGKFYPRRAECFGCGRRRTTYQEKMTDSAIASHLVADALLDRFDTAVLIGGDTDIVPALKMVREHRSTKKIVAWFPPNRLNQDVEAHSDESEILNGAHFGAALMPEAIDIGGGITIRKPEIWCASHPLHKPPFKPPPTAQCAICNGTGRIPKPTP